MAIIDFEINELMKMDTKSLIEVAESNFNSTIEEFASEIERNKEHKFICIAGPSCSGKTTTANLLRKKLFERNIPSVVISLDNFYRPKEELPRLPDGSIDYEAVDALDLQSVHTCLTELLVQKRTLLPIFDFMIAKRSDKHIDLVIDDDTVIIIEGIHALNPLTIPSGISKYFYKVYISVGSGFTLNGELLVRARKLRLTRRIIRDFRDRNSTVENTLDMWPSVCEGEDRYIKPFKDGSNLIINSTHMYEVFLYRDIILKMLLSVGLENNYREQIDELINIYEKIASDINIVKEEVPTSSLLREFIGE